MNLSKIEPHKLSESKFNTQQNNLKSKTQETLHENISENSKAQKTKWLLHGVSTERFNIQTNSHRAQIFQHFTQIN